MFISAMCAGFKQKKNWHLLIKTKEKKYLTLNSSHNTPPTNVKIIFFITYT